MAEEIDANEVEFNAQIVAAAWESFDDGIPAMAAEAILSEFYDYDVAANSGVEADRDVLFPEIDVMVEEKAIGVCDRETAEKYAASFIELERDDDRVLSLNGAAVYEGHTIPEA
jgi:hypothetical protein